MVVLSFWGGGGGGGGLQAQTKKQHSQHFFISISKAKGKRREA